MRILRAITRRGFNIASAGYFSVLRPNTWFPASRLTGRVHHSGARSRVLSGPALETSSEMTIAPRIITLNGHDRRFLRRGLIVLAAMAITSLLLLWIIQPY
jgi:hypothetical protein